MFTEDIKGLWITTITLEPLLHGNSVYTNYITQKLSKHFKLDLLYYPHDQNAKNLKNLDQFENIHYLKKEKSVIPNICNIHGRNNNGNLINHSLICWIEEKFKHNLYDFVICDYIFLSRIFDVLPKNTLKIINTHDIWGDRHIGLNWNDKMKKQTFCCSKDEELISFRKSDMLVTISDSEKEIIKKRLQSIKKRVKVNTISYCPNNSNNLNCAKVDNNVLKIGFIGSDNFLNVNGINNFIKHLSKFKFKNIELHIAGLVCSKVEFDYDWIFKKGVIDDANIADFYKSINLIVNPMQKNSTGLKIKSVFAISNEIPIIGTRDAFSGMKVTSKWHTISNIEDLATKVYNLSKFTNLVDEIQIASQQLNNKFKKKTDLQFQQFIKEIKKKVYKQKDVKNYLKTFIQNSRGNVIEKNVDERLDQIDLFNSTYHLTATSKAYFDKVTSLINHRDGLLTRVNKMTTKLEKLQKLNDQIKSNNKLISHYKDELKARTEVNKNLRNQLKSRIEENKNLNAQLNARNSLTVHLKEQLEARTKVNKNLKLLLKFKEE